MPEPIFYQFGHPTSPPPSSTSKGASTHSHHQPLRQGRMQTLSSLPFFLSPSITVLPIAKLMDNVHPQIVGKGVSSGVDLGLLRPSVSVPITEWPNGFEDSDVLALDYQDEEDAELLEAEGTSSELASRSNSILAVSNTLAALLEPPTAAAALLSSSTSLHLFSNSSSSSSDEDPQFGLLEPYNIGHSTLQHTVSWIS